LQHEKAAEDQKRADDDRKRALDLQEEQVKIAKMHADNTGEFINAFKDLVSHVISRYCKGK
jgi:hypothetical protein